MSVRFVEFKISGGAKILINPANVCWVQQQTLHTDRVAVGTSDGDSPCYVVGTLEEVIDKLTRKTSPESFQPHSTT
jgi:hypothetical protein